ncbi:MAG TPA: thioesterase family protein [Steroidobacteraceae bacterium]|nr:thioesterase family protein [Steroidobacteraceae bacterium]
MDGELFKCELRVGWGQVDFNQHMGNTAYLDLAVDARFLYFASRGLPVSELMRLQIGPVVVRDELEYFSELRLMDPVTVTLELEGLSTDGAQMRLRNEFFRSDGKRAARVTSQGLWMNLQTRRPVVPPDVVIAALRGLARTADYRELPAREGRARPG